MRLLAPLLMFFMYAVALDLETVRKNSDRFDPASDGHLSQRVVLLQNSLRNRLLPNGQPVRRTMNDFVENMIYQEDSGQDSVEHRKFSSKPGHMEEIKPPYDKDDSPSYPQGRQEGYPSWAFPAATQKSALTFAKRQLKTPYRSHKQLPYSIRVPDDEPIRKRAARLGQRTSELAPAVKRQKRTMVVSDSTKTNVTESKMSPKQFRDWLTDEYYRNMAMSFATMRKRRSVISQRERIPVEDETLTLEQLRDIEEALLQNAVALFQDGNPNQAKLRSQILERIAMTQDIKNLKETMRALYLDSKKTNNMDGQRSRFPTGTKGSDRDGCGSLLTLSSGCSAVRGMFPPLFVQDRFIEACNIHEICYACGAQRGIKSEECDQTFLEDMRMVCLKLGTCNRYMVSMLLEPLHKKRIYSERDASPICDKPCVATLLERD